MPASIADPSTTSKEKLMLLERKLIDLAYGKVKFSVVAGLLLASLLVTALWSVIEHERLLAWLTAMVAIQMLNFFYARRYMRFGGGGDVGKWKMGLVISAAAAGLGWGSTVFCFPSTPFNPLTLFGVFVLPSTPFDPVTVLLIFILAGVTAYASVAMAFVSLAAFAFFACAWLPLAIWLFSFGEQMYVAMGLIALSYLGVMVMLSRRMHVTVCSLLSVTEENRGLRTAQQESDQRMAHFFENAPGFFYTAHMRPDGKTSWSFASAGIRDLFDVTVEEMKASITPLISQLCADDIEPFIVAREVSRKNLSPLHLEFRINHRQKGERWIELNSQPQRELDGSTVWHGFMQDITARKQTERYLENTRARLQTVMSAIPDMIWLKDADGVYLSCNPAFERFFGASEAEIIGKTDYDFVETELADFFRQKDRDAIEAGRICVNEESITYADDGRAGMLETRKMPVLDHDGKVAGVLGVARDITEMHQLQQRQKQFFAAAPGLFATIEYRADGSFAMPFVSDGAREVYGLEPEAIMQDIGVLMTVDHPDDATITFRKTMESARELTPFHVEYRINHPSKGVRWLEARSMPQRLPDGGTRWNGFFHDITERKHMQDEIAAREREFRTLAENTPDPIYRYDRDCRRIYVNQAVVKISGKPLESFIGSTPVDGSLLASGHSTRLMESIRSVFASGEMHSLMVEFVAQDAVPREYHMLLIPEFDANGQVATVLAMARDVTEMYRLQQQQAQFFAMAPGLFATIEHSADGSYAMPFASEGIRELYGLEPEEVMQDVGALVARAHPDDVEMVFSKTLESERDLTPYHVEYRINHPGKGLRWLEVRAMPQRMADGGTRWEGFYHDITERKRMEDALAAREQEFRTLAENFPDVVVRYGLDLKRVYANPALAELAGVSAGQMLGKSPQDNTPLTDPEGYMAELRKVMQSGVPFGVELPVRRANGEAGWYAGSFVPEFDTRGNLTSVLMVARDITERKRMEQTLAASEDKHRTVFESANDGIFLHRIVERDGNTEFVLHDLNQKGCELWGCSREDILTGNFDLLAMNNPPYSFDEATRRNRLAAAGEPQLFDWELKRGDGSKVWGEVSLRRIQIGDEAFLLSVMRDFTERKLAQQQLHLLDTAISHSNDAIFLIDKNSRFHYVNDAACRNLGYSREALLGMGILDIDPLITQEKILEGMALLATGGAFPPTMESLHRARDGREFPVELSTSVVEHKGEKFILSVARDITERKKMELALQESEAQYRHNSNLLQSIFESPSQMGIYALDREYRYLAFNSRFREGAKRLWNTDIAVGMSMLDSIDSDAHREICRQGFEQVLAGHSFSLETKETVVKDDVTTYEYHENYGAPIRNDNGEIIGLTIFATEITERKRIQEALAERERDFRSLAANLPDNIARFDVEGRYLYVNPTHERLLGVAASELIGKPLPDTHEHVKTAVAQVLASGQAVELVRQTVLVNGELQIHEVSIVPELDAAGRIVSVLGIGRNMTEYYRMRDTIAAREQLMRTVIDATPDWIFIKDREHRYQLVNRGYADALHLAPQDFIGKNDLDLGFPEELVKGNPEKGIRGFWADDRLVLDSKETRVFSDDPATIDSVVHTFHTIKVPLLDADEKSWGVLSFARDITERKQAELALRESGEKLRNLYEYSPVGIALTDMNGRYIEFNEAFRAICGYPHEELMALDYWTLTPREYEAQEMAQMESLEKTGRYGPYLKEYVRRDGSRVPIQLNGALIIGKDMKPYIWSIVEDISARKEAEEQLKDKLERIVELNEYLEKNARTLEEQAVELEASQDQLKEALEFSNGVINAIPDILFEMDLDGRYHGIWTQQPELLAAQKALLLNKTVYEVLPPEAAEAAMTGIREAKENGVAYGQVLSITGADGVERWFEHSISRKQGRSPSDIRFIVLSREVTERQRTEEVLRFIAQGEWMKGGESFLDTLVHYLGKSLSVDYVVIDKFADEPGYVETVARYAKGEIVPNVRYALQSTPCGEVMTGIECCHGANIQGLFPEASLLKDMQVESYVGIPLLGIDGAVIGLIAVLNEQPLGGAHFVKSILQMVASSAAAELVRGRMEQVLREHYDALNEAQRISHVGNWELELASGALLWSDEIYRIFEIDPERFGASYEAFIDVIHPDDREMVNCAYSESLASREPYEIEHRLLFADGRIKYVHERSETRYDDDGKPLRSLGTVQDITSRKQAEESLRESYEKISELNRHLKRNTEHLEKNAVHLEENARYLEEQATELEASQEQLKQTEAWYRSILHSAPDGMLVVDDRGLIMQVNARLEAMFGYEGGELPGHRVEVLLPKAFRESHTGQRGEYFANGAANHPAMIGKTLFGCRKDGSTFPVDVSLSRLPDLDGRRSAICASVRDITERQAMEVARETALSEAQRLVQLRSAFMAQMSHELRTPLNGILGYTQNLLQGEALGEKQVAGLNIIQHSGEHLLSLINGLLDHAAIEAGKFELVLDDIELDPFLSAIIGIIRVRAEQKNLAFTCDAGGDLPAVVRGDAQRLRQVLINLLANAVKFTDRGDVILRVHLAPPTRIRFEVQDSGVGIAADQLENIFLPFEQTGELQRRAGGSGLGLAISRTLVKLMGGDIRVESQPGAGSTFSFEIEVGVVQSGGVGLDAAALSERAETRAAQASSMLPAPSRQELDALHALALRGGMRDVTRHLDRLVEADARYQPFAEQLRRLAQSFQTKALLGLIEQYRNREQES